MENIGELNDELGLGRKRYFKKWNRAEEDMRDMSSRETSKFCEKCVE